MNTFRNAFRLAAFYAMAAATTAHALSAHAGDHAYRLDNAAYRQECGSCHVAYPPQLLSAPSWRAVMRGLGAHFGVDASLEPAAQREIAAWLEVNAGRRDTAAAGKPLLRVSSTPWFQKEHRREIAADKALHPEVKTLANCGACHQGAEQGNYSEREIRVPGGRTR